MLDAGELNMSKPQEILGLFLEKLGLIVEGETKIGKHRVDFWLPELRTAVEWDGPWHMFTKADEKRDEALKEFGVNDNPTKETAEIEKGRWAEASYSPTQKVQWFDRTKDSRLANLVQKKDRIGHSMGALVERTECSLPWCRFHSDGRITCDHIKNGAGKANIERGHLVYESMMDYYFVESSSVEDPAYPIALSDRIWGI